MTYDRPADPVENVGRNGMTSRALVTAAILSLIPVACSSDDEAAEGAGAGDGGSSGATSANPSDGGPGGSNPTTPGTDDGDSSGVDPTAADSTSGETTGEPPSGGGSDLPVPPGPDDLPAPSGAPGNLRVLDWAGFAAALSYTYDDGQPTHIEHWPALAATGTRMTFYVTTGNSGIPGYPETFMDALASGSEIANHTVNHCNFDQACGAAAPGSHASELDDADAYITGTLGAPAVYTMAYPFGDTGYASAVAERYLLARGVSSGRIAPLDGTDPFNLPTFALQGGETLDVFESAIDDTRAAGEWLTLLLHSILPGDNWYAGVELDVITGSIAHAQGYGDVWIDSLINVGAYWRGQQVVAAADVSVQGDTTTLTWTLPDHFPPDRYVRVTVDGGTLSQGGAALSWDGHGYYEVALDAGTLTIAP